MSKFNKKPSRIWLNNIHCKNSDNLNTVQQAWNERINKEERAVYASELSIPAQEELEPIRNRSLGMTFINY